MGDAEAAAARAGRAGGAAAGMRVFSPEYYALCAGGGMLAAGATHLAITPLDVLKVNMQHKSLVKDVKTEHTVDFLYKKVIQKEKENCSTIQQLGATCLAGYISGAVGTVVSNPADNIVSALYNKKADNIIHAVKSIGFRNLLTRSLPIRITLVGPVITMQWFFYDTIKILTGLPTTGGLPRELEEVNI
nr:unnamed protein product [Digitaria exilis]